MGRGDESLIAKSRSRDQDGRHAQGHLNIKFKLWFSQKSLGLETIAA